MVLTIIAVGGNVFIIFPAEYPMFVKTVEMDNYSFLHAKTL